MSKSFFFLNCLFMDCTDFAPPRQQFVSGSERLCKLFHYEKKWITLKTYGTMRRKSYSWLSLICIDLNIRGFFLIGPPFGRNYNCSCVPQNDSEQSLHIRAVPTVAQHLYFSMLTFSGDHQNDILYKLHKLWSKIRKSVIRSSLKILILCRKSYLKICYPILKGANIGLIA